MKKSGKPIATTREDTGIAVVYGRVSTNKQQDSLDLQEKQALEYVTKKDFTFHPWENGVFLDEAESGGDPFFERPAAKRLFAVLRSHKEIRHVVMSNLDRLGRTARDHHNVVHELGQLGVAIHILDFFGREVRSDDPMDQFIFGILAQMAQLELAMIRKRIQKRVTENFDNFLLIGTVPYGFDVEKIGSKKDKNTGKEKNLYRLVPNLPEQQIILRMRRQFDAGCSIHEIAAQLNHDAIPTKLPKGTRIKLRNANPRTGVEELWGETSGRWQGSQVQKILTSKHTQRFLQENADRAVAEGEGGSDSDAPPIADAA